MWYWLKPDPEPEKSVQEMKLKSKCHQYEASVLPSLTKCAKISQEMNTCDMFSGSLNSNPKSIFKRDSDIYVSFKNYCITFFWIFNTSYGWGQAHSSIKFITK